MIWGKVKAEASKELSFWTHSPGVQFKSKAEREEFYGSPRKELAEYAELKESNDFENEDSEETEEEEDSEDDDAKSIDSLIGL